MAAGVTRVYVDRRGLGEQRPPVVVDDGQGPPVSCWAAEWDGPARITSEPPGFVGQGGAHIRVWVEVQGPVTPRLDP